MSARADGVGCARRIVERVLNDRISEVEQEIVVFEPSDVRRLLQNIRKQMLRELSRKERLFVSLDAGFVDPGLMRER